MEVSFHFVFVFAVLFFMLFKRNITHILTFKYVFYSFIVSVRRIFKFLNDSGENVYLMLEHMKLCFLPHGTFICFFSIPIIQSSYISIERSGNLWVPVGPIRSFGSSSANFLMIRKF
jgi:hypothetical protein